MNLMPGNFYTRKGIWNEFYPDRPYPNGGPWVTGYTTEKNYLIALQTLIHLVELVTIFQIK